MKVLIQHCNSNEYLSGSNEWVREPERALVFPSSVKAMEYLHACGVHPAKVVLKFSDARYDMALAKTADC